VTQWSGKEMKPLSCMIVPVFAATLLNPSASQTVSFTAALWCIKNLAYFHLMAQYQYHTEATIEYIQNHLEEFHCDKNVLSWWHTSKSAKKVSEALKKQLTLHQQKMKWHSQYSEHFEIQVRLFSIMQCTLAGNVLSKIVFISLRDFQTWYNIPNGV